MNIVNRFHRIRELDTLRGYGPPYICSQKRAQWDAELIPVDGSEEWYRNPKTGVWSQVRNLLLSESGALNWRRYFNQQTIGFNIQGAVSFNTKTLDSAYTAGSAGDAASCLMLLPETLTLNKLYFYIASFGGTAASVTDIEGEVRSVTVANPHLGLPNTTGGGLVVAAQTVNPGGATGWHAITGYSTSIPGDARYHFIIRDANGNATNFARVRYEIVNLGAGPSYYVSESCHTSDGFINITLNPEVGCILPSFSDGSTWGVPYTSSTAVAVGSYQRGIKIAGGFPIGVKIYGMCVPDLSGINGIRLWEGTDGPTGGSPVSGTTIIYNHAATVAQRGALFSSPQTLNAGTQYRIVYTYGSGSTLPQILGIGTGANADLRSAMIGGGNWCYTRVVTGAWSDDNDGIPHIALYIDDIVPGAGGPSGALMRHPSMTGRLSA